MTLHNFSFQPKEENLAARLRKSGIIAEVSFQNVYYFIFLKRFNYCSFLFHKL